MPASQLRIWLHGLVAATISGGASAVTAAFSAQIVAPKEFNMANKFGHTIELMAAMFVINALIGMMAYLKQSPIPPDAEEAAQPPAAKAASNALMVILAAILLLSVAVKATAQSDRPNQRREEMSDTEVLDLHQAEADERSASDVLTKERQFICKNHGEDDTHSVDIFDGYVIVTEYSK